MRVPLGAVLQLHIKTNATKPFDTQMAAEVARMAGDPRLAELIRGEICDTEEERQLVERLLSLRSSWFKQSPYGGMWEETYTIHADGLQISVKTPCKGRGRNNKEFKDQPKAIREYIVNERALWDRARADKIKIEAALNNIFEHCSTVQQAEKVLPSIINWLPDEAKQRYYAAAPKRSAKPDFDAIKSESLDNDTIAAMTRAKMQG